MAESPQKVIIFSSDVAPSKVPANIRWHNLTDYDANHLCEQIAKLSKNDAVVVMGIENLRFANIDAPNAPVAKTWYKLNIKLQSAQELPLEHIFELGTRIAEASRDLNLRCLLICSGAGLPSELPRSIIDQENIRILSPELTDFESNLKSIRDSALKAFKTGGISQAMSIVAQAKIDEVNMAIFLSELFTLAGEYHHAFAILRPHMAQIELRAEDMSLLSLSQTALLAGESGEAKRLLMCAEPKDGACFEALRTALTTANRLGVTEMVARLRELLEHWYPTHPFTLGQAWYKALDNADFDNCLNVARKLGDKFMILKSCYFAGSMDDIKFLAEATGSGWKDEALWFLARRHESQGNWSLAREYAKGISTTTDHYGAVVELWAKTLREQIPVLLPEELYNELIPLLRYCAKVPSDLDARYAIEKLSDSDVTMSATRVVLIKALLDEIERVAIALNNSNLNFEQSPFEWEFDAENLSDHAFMETIRQFFQSEVGKCIPIGYGEIDALIRPKINSRFVAGLSATIRFGVTNQPSDKLLMRLLHFIILSAKLTSDPHSDLFAASTILNWDAQFGQVQHARDLAETMLIVLPASQPNQSSWRRSISWANYADVLVRAHNPVTALHYILYAFFELPGSPSNLNLIANLFHVSAIVLRELRFFDLAYRPLLVERELITAYPQIKHRLGHVKQVELSILMQSLDRDTIPEEAGTLCSEIVEELKALEGREYAPLLSLLAAGIKKFKIFGFPIRPEWVNAFEEYLPKVQEPMRTLIAQQIENETFSFESLTHLLSTLGDSRYLDDIQYQIRPAIGPAKAAIIDACARGDKELFSLAHTILAQPGLAFAELHPENNDGPQEDYMRSSWLAEKIASGASTDSVVDAMRLQSLAAGNKPLLTLADLARIQWTDWQAMLAEEETLLLLACDDESRMFKWSIRKTDSGTPVAIPIHSWDGDRFRAWGQLSAEQYDPWIFELTSTVLKPELSATIRSFEGLLLGFPADPGHLIIVPDTQIADFTFSLAVQVAGIETPVSVVPSGLWLSLKRRQVKKEVLFGRVAWLGGPQVNDNTLRFLREGLAPHLKQGNFELKIGDQPEDCSSREIVLLGGHGGRDLLMGFSHVTDRQNILSPDRIARSLKNTRCVILFVCHSGQIDRQPYSHEVKGLIASLFQDGVSCVVACPWTVDAKLAIRWFEYFLITDSKDYIAKRVDSALRLLAGNYNNHPVIRRLFTVYGDGGIYLSS